MLIRNSNDTVRPLRNIVKPPIGMHILGTWTGANAALAWAQRWPRANFGDSGSDARNDNDTQAVGVGQAG